MKLRLMIEGTQTSKVQTPDTALIELREQRHLSLVGLEEYVKRMVKSALNGNLQLNFALRVVDDDNATTD